MKINADFHQWQVNLDQKKKTIDIMESIGVDSSDNTYFIRQLIK